MGEAGDAVFRAALVAQVDAFAALVRGGTSTAATAADAVAALQAVEIGTAMYRTSDPAPDRATTDPEPA